MRRVISTFGKVNWTFCVNRVWYIIFTVKDLSKSGCWRSPDKTFHRHLFDLLSTGGYTTSTNMRNDFDNKCESTSTNMRDYFDKFAKVLRKICETFSTNLRKYFDKYARLFRQLNRLERNLYAVCWAISPLAPIAVFCLIGMFNSCLLLLAV
jgi:hypothetical protein